MAENVCVWACACMYECSLHLRLHNNERISIKTVHSSVSNQSVPLRQKSVALCQISQRQRVK